MAECPHCGGEIILSPGQNPGQIVGKSHGQIGAKSGANSDLTIDFSSKDQAPKGRVYNQNYSLEFEQFWEVYPLHRGKLVGQTVWANSVKSLVKSEGISPAEARAKILAGAARYRDDPNRLDQYTQRASTWLHAGGWDDDPLPTRIDDRRRPPERPAPMTDGEWARHIERALGDRDE